LAWPNRSSESAMIRPKISASILSKNGRSGSIWPRLTRERSAFCFRLYNVPLSGLGTSTRRSLGRF
jgi:hypothetical protein